MPCAPSWNGKWSGDGEFYAIVQKFSVKQYEKARKILEGEYYQYRFGDGWVAGIDAKEVDAKEAKKIKKNSLGFCGYDWMVDSIIKDGVIKA